MILNHRRPTELRPLKSERMYSVAAAGSGPWGHPYRRFTVRPPDPHNFDGDHNGIGCES